MSYRFKSKMLQKARENLRTAILLNKPESEIETLKNLVIKLDKELKDIDKLAGRYTDNQSGQYNKKL